MKERPVPTAIFDLDGTLIDSAPDLHAALNLTLRENGFGTVTLQTVRHVVGHGAKAMIRQALESLNATTADDQIERMFNGFLTYYQADICTLSTLYPYILDTLEGLRTNGVKIVVATNKMQDLSEQVLKMSGLSGRIDGLVGPDRARNKKPSPDHLEDALTLVGGTRERAVMIGDATPDIRAAQALGIPAIAMRYGYADCDLDTLGPHIILDDARPLMSTILKLLA